MKGKEQSKINGKIVKDLEKHINAIEKAMLIVFSVSIKMNITISKGRTETRIASGFRNPESLMALRKLPLNLVFDVSRSVVSNGRWQRNTFITGVNQFCPNYRRHMAAPYGPGSIKSSVSARAARIEGSHARPADIGRHPLCTIFYNWPMHTPILCTFTKYWPTSFNIDNYNVEKARAKWMSWVKRISFIFAYQLYLRLRYESLAVEGTTD
ncbi:hypothetical protein ALC53_09433 [Atta colombica]|uniref:Uncharacterized protein n=1 Tax=Atta colombica TaxID=520822 RepID=A0A195B817_9HYME|nr:hypothetical protein ALC53_09433 [Atta colombica]